MLQFVKPRLGWVRLQAENVAKKQAASKRAAAAAAAGPDAKPGKRKKAWWEEELEDADKRKRMRDTTEEDAQYYREEVPFWKHQGFEVVGSTYLPVNPLKLCLNQNLPLNFASLTLPFANIHIPGHRGLLLTSVMKDFPTLEAWCCCAAE